METDIVIFWFLLLSCVSGLVMVLVRFRSSGKGWLFIYSSIVLAALIGQFSGKGGWLYAGLGLWVVLVLLPALLVRIQSRYFLQQRYGSARRLAVVLSWLHPADGWREQPKVIHALELAQNGDLSTATEALRQFQGSHSLLGLAAVTNIYRLTQHWEELLEWDRQRGGTGLEGHPQLLPILLRAYGEIGDLNGLVQIYERNKSRIAGLVPASSRDMCRLVLFAFTGHRAAVEQLLAGSLSVLPTTAQRFWLATADFSSGAIEAAQGELEALLPRADPAVRLAIERRLSRISLPPAQLDETSRRVVEEATRDQGHDEHFGASRSLFSKQALGTQLLIVVNLLSFLAEMALGGATNPGTLYRLGALFPPSVRAGEWWRLVASLFLHWGPLHLAMNMVALWMLGPFVEFALGLRRYLLVYLIAGTGSMGAVMLFAIAGKHPGQLAVGASGCIMGLVGATGALMLRGWLREKALTARRRLVAILLIIAMQTVFDSMVPQVSMTAHLSGALIGFFATLAIRDRLRRSGTVYSFR
jgi:rhomboid protease GluP